MPGIKTPAAGRQTATKAVAADSTTCKPHTVKPRSKAFSTPKLSADAHVASNQEIAREADSSRIMNRVHTVAKPILSNITTPTTYTSPPKPSPVPGFYPFGWDAHPTRARLNEVCRAFLQGKCSWDANCDRIHPRDRNSTPESHIFVVKLPTQQSSLSDNVYNTTPTVQITGTRALSLPSEVKPGAPLRYDLKRGVLPYQAESDSGQASDSSQYFSANSSPSGSSCSLTSEDSEATKTTMHPPPFFTYLCRHWLMKQCERSYDCRYVHGDLEYDPPVNGIYPPPISHSPCRRNQGRCLRGYLCDYFHDDLKYGKYLKPSEETFSTERGVESPDCLPPRSSLDHVSMVTQGAVKTEKVTHAKYPPPRSNHFCQKWLINQCYRGPTCSFFHGDVEYDPPVIGIHPPPRYTQVCKLWKLHECSRGFACDFMHEDLKYDTVEPRERPQAPLRIGPQASISIPEGKHSRPRFPETCQQWIRNMCQRGYSCDYVHLDLAYDDLSTEPPPVLRTVLPIVKTPLVGDSVKDPPVGMRPPPKSSDTCIQWLRDRCHARYACKYRHDDLDYDPPSDHAPADNNVPSNMARNNYTSTEARAWSVKVHDHAKVKLGPGFEIQDLETGFETPWIYLGNVPARASAEDVAKLLRRFGEVVDVRLPIRMNNPSMLVRARFSSPVEAREASTSLNGAEAFGCKISARLPVHDASRHNAMFEDTTVRIRWEAPSKVAYCGYSTMEHADEALAAARKPFRDHYVHASIHVGLPVVGVVTVRFRGVPLDASREDMARFAKPEDVVWARPNYQSLDYATKSVKRILQEGMELLDLLVQPPPYRSGAMVQAWAHFSTPSDAKAACGRLHGRKPVFTGKTRIFAQHVQSLTFFVSPSMYEKLGCDIQALCRTVYHVRRTAMLVIQRPAPMQTLVKLSGDDVKELGQLKAEFEKILNWETVRQGANIAWDPFFAHPAGKAFLEGIERVIPAVIVRVDIPRRMILLLGSSKSRLTVRERILSKMSELRSQQVRTIPLDGWLLGLFMRKDLALLQNQVGRENVDLDFRYRRLIVRGSNATYETAQDAVRRARKAQLYPTRRRNAAECPVCFDEVTSSVTLPCGHSWCRDCISRYLTSAIDNKYFPLTCLGGDAKCTEHIPLQIARNLLPIPEFDAVVDAALAFYIQSRPGEFHYCPSPDCPQIYRRAPRETVLQCPSCLLRICPSCHVEAHDGFACPDPEADNNLFREWMKTHDVKPCPGCKVPIERAEGCNHMTCTQCKTHICWVCLQTFPKGDGIYDHMRAVHGGIGLGVD